MIAIATGDDGNTAGILMFTSVSPPKIIFISHQSLVRWRKERKAYESYSRTDAGP